MHYCANLKTASNRPHDYQKHNKHTIPLLSILSSLVFLFYFFFECLHFVPEKQEFKKQNQSLHNLTELLSRGQNKTTPCVKVVWFWLVFSFDVVYYVCGAWADEDLLLCFNLLLLCSCLFSLDPGGWRITIS